MILPNIMDLVLLVILLYLMNPVDLLNLANHVILVVIAILMEIVTLHSISGNSISGKFSNSGDSKNL